MAFIKTIQPLIVVLLQTTVLFAGCKSRPADIPEDEKTKAITRDYRQEEALLTSASATEPTESRKVQGKPIQNTLPLTGKNESQQDQEWGREVNLNEMVAMAEKGRIVEIQWHVMPNILRAQDSDGRIYHLRNESKGVDLRKTLINAGIKIGKGGILFRHVF